MVREFITLGTFEGSLNLKLRIQSTVLATSDKPNLRTTKNNYGWFTTFNHGLYEKIKDYKRIND